VTFAACLFLLTAIATGWQVYWLMMWGFWGKPSDPLECVSLFGSLFLLIGAVFAFLGRPSAGLVAGAGCLLLWTFYAPATWQTVVDARSGQGRFNPIVFVPPVLLLGSSLLCPIVVRYGGNQPTQPEPPLSGDEPQ
jgi:hypothetical protein